MAKKRSDIDFPEKYDESKCFVCGSKMRQISKVPNIWYCPKCGAKKAGER